MNNTSNTSTLASVIKSILNSNQEGVSVKEAIPLAEQMVKDNSLNVIVNYRSVYQQLKTQGVKLSKGKFALKQSPVEEQVAA
jgi:hypothetical protein